MFINKQKFSPRLASADHTDYQTVRLCFDVKFVAYMSEKSQGSRKNLQTVHSKSCNHFLQNNIQPGN